MVLLKNYCGNTTSPILFKIDVEIIQDLTKSHLGYELTDMELERLATVFTEQTDLMINFILESITKIKDDTGSDWSEVDQMFIKRIGNSYLGGYEVAE